MAPPAGSSSMLRSRRRDATLKPNRTLDRSGSRGMLYENEELRLRTININAEVEKGQNYIKKLRRENEQLKREIWNLREEYERLENYVKSREQSENEEEDDVDPVEIAEEEPEVAETNSPLETVVEEDYDQSEQPVDESNDRSEPSKYDPGGHGDEVDAGGDDNNSKTVGGDVDRLVIVDDIALSCATTATVTVDTLAVPAVHGDGDDDGDCTDRGRRQQQQLAVDDATARDCATVPLRPESLAVPVLLQLQDGQPHPDTVQPHTACFDTGNHSQLHDLTVDEVIDAVQDAELRDKLRTVCLTDERCYMTFANGECLERALHTAFKIRDVPVLLMDTGSGATILSLAGVPDAVTDKDVLKSLKKYGTIIGGVERKTARGGTTGGERYVRVRLILGAPRYLWFGSDKVIVRQLTEHETGTMNSIARRKSFRSQIKLNLKMADPSPSNSAVVTTGSSVAGYSESKENGSGGGGSTTVHLTTVSSQNGFRFPSDSRTVGSTTAAEQKTAPINTTGSPKKSKTSKDGCPPTTSSMGPAESPVRGRRRPSLMGYRRDTVKHRGGSLSRAEAGDDADSDTSTIFRRKLSITGREGTEKVPWCGCWGNGCL